MRIHHLFIGLIILSLFAVVFASFTQDLYNGLGVEGHTNMTDSKNATVILDELSILSDTESTVGEIADVSPGGIDSTSQTDESSDIEGSLQKSGLGVVTKVGIFLFSVPRVVFTAMGQFFGIDDIFIVAGITVFVLIVSIILVSSILRNRI